MTPQEEVAWQALLAAAKAVCLESTVAPRSIPERVHTAIYELGKAHDAVLDARDAAERKT
jgi:hypothetical protein